MAKSEDGLARLGKAKDRMEHWVAKEGEGEIAEIEKKNEDKKTAENIEGNAVETEIMPTRRWTGNVRDRKSLTSRDRR